MVNRFFSPKYRLLWTLLLALVLSASVAAIGIIEKNRTASIIADVLQSSSFLTTNLSDIGETITPGRLIGLALAFVSGMVAAVNPCGFAMLPAYLSLYLSDGEKKASTRSKLLVARQILRALVVSVMIGLGFIILFGSAGLLVAGISTSTTFFSDSLPWIGFGLGIVMISLGVYVLLGGKLYSALPQRYASRVGKSGQVSLWGYLLFGISYALASLSCTLPLFIATMVNAFSSGGFVSVVLTFSVYALGMVTVITIVTLGVAIFKSVVTGFLFKILPAVNTISAIIIVFVGGYLMLYWLVEGNLICISNGQLTLECGI